MSLSQPVTRYRDFISNSGPAGRLRMLARDSAVWALSFASSGAAGAEWIRFPFYHHVFDDERRGFARQLDFMGDMGDFVSIGQALDMLWHREPGRVLVNTCTLDHPKALPLYQRFGFRPYDRREVAAPWQDPDNVLDFA